MLAGGDIHYRAPTSGEPRRTAVELVDAEKEIAPDHPVFRISP